MAYYAWCSLWRQYCSATEKVSRFKLRNFVQQYYIISCLQKFHMSTGVGYFWGKRKRTVLCAWREQFKRGPVPSARAVSLSAVRNGLIYLTTTDIKKKIKVNGSIKFLLASIPQSYKIHIVSDWYQCSDMY